MPYSVIITKADLSTNTYAEIIAEITRDNDDIVDKAIARAIGEMKSYLSKYDLVKIFGEESSDTAASYSDEYLSGLLKDIVMWHIIKLGNVNLDYDHIRNCYKDAIKALEAIRNGTTDPDGWPLIDGSTLTTEPGIKMSIKTNPKRNNSY
jgi:hypothetical protein